MDRLSASIVLFVIGAVTLLTGLVYGLGSRYVTYAHVQQGTIAHFISADGVGYIQMAGNSSLYIVHEDDFRPMMSDYAQSFGDGATLSLVYDPSETTSIDVTSRLGTHLIGDASKVVEMTLQTTSGPTQFVTPDYTQHRDGYSINRWPVASILIAVGVLIVAITGFFFSHHNRKSDITEHPRERQASIPS